ALFGVIGLVMRIAPVGAFGAMAFTIGAYGAGSLVSLGKLMAGVYATSFLFVFVVLGVIAYLTGFNLWRFLAYIKEEIFLVLGTSSSESALPGLMKKLEHAGAARTVVQKKKKKTPPLPLARTPPHPPLAPAPIAHAFNIDLPLAHPVRLLPVPP